MRRITVLDLRDTDEIGGPGKTILETFKAIDRERFDLHVAVFRRDDERGETPFLRAARAIGLPAHEIRARNQFDPRLIARTAALVKHLGVDVVHSHEVKSDVIAYFSSRWHPVATMTTLHGWIGNSLRQRALIALDRRLVGQFDCVVAVSGQIREQLLASGVPPAKLRLVHNAIVLDNYRPTGQRGLLRSLVDRPLPRPLIVTIGRLSREKGHADLIEALARVANHPAPWSAVLVGDGPERGVLAARLASVGLADRVHLVGYLDRPQQVLEDADLMVLPSHTEGLPNVALEALAMGVPVLATRVGGTPEVIEDGVTGRLVPASAPTALAEALLDFLHAPERWLAMARRGGAMVAERFDFNARTKTMEALYTELGTRST